MSTIRTLAMTVAAACLATVAAHAAQKKWTFMVYIDGDNNLESYVTLDIEQELALSGASSSPDVNVVALADRIPGYDASRGNWTSTKFFYITPGMHADAASAVADWGERNMGNPQTVIDFVAYCRTNYPADHYALSFWNHGGGWSGVCWDDSSVNDYLKYNELKAARSSLGFIDVIMFDACNMGCAEEAALWHGYATAVCASEETFGMNAIEYDYVLSRLVANPDSTPDQVAIWTAQSAIWQAGEMTCSAVATDDRVHTLFTAMDQWSVAMMAGLPANRSAYTTAFAAAARPGDLWDMAYQISNRISDTTIKAGAQAVMDAFTTVVLWEGHAAYEPEVHGLTIYYITQPSQKDSTYTSYRANVDLALHTYWDEFLDAYASTSVGPFVPRMYITNIVGTVAVPYTTTNQYVAGTNNIPVVGGMTWTNSLGGGGSFAAARSWNFTSPLSFGTNVITVCGTNAVGIVGSNAVSVIRTLAAFIDITNVTGIVIVPGTPTSQYIAGTNNTFVVGGMTWTNSRGGGDVLSHVPGNWSFAATLYGGYNVITVSGTNDEGATVDDFVTVVCPPAAPTGLGAVPSGGAVVLSWTAATGATNYHVKRSTTSGSGYTTVGTPSGTTYTDSSVLNGTTYYYVVSATNVAGESANSVQIAVSFVSVTVGNMGFEIPALASGGYQYMPAGASWTFSSAGVAHNGSTWYSPSAPEGTQGGFIQAQGASISQSLAFDATGSYVVSFSVVGRSLGSISLNVLIDDTNVLDLTAAQVKTNVWKTKTSAVFNVAAGEHILKFKNGTESGDLSDVIDNVKVTGFLTLPSVDITNESATVSYDVTTFTIGGTNSPLLDTTNLVIGSMWWVNGLNGAHGEFAATSSWIVADIPLAYGANHIAVYGTNEFGLISGDSVVITRSRPFFLDITNAAMTVAYDVTDCAVAGTNTSDIVGGMWVSNASIGGAAIAFARSGLAFAAPPVAVQVGTNVIRVYGSNAADYISSDRATLVRGPVGTGAPYVDITNDPQVVSYDATSFTVCGTNTMHVMGRMRWTNSVTRAVGGFAAAASWSIAGIALGVGDNTITAYGTNAWGVMTNDSVTITRGGIGTGAPFVDITNGPPAELNYHVDSFNLGGTNNMHVTGGMWWTNASGASSGAASRPAGSNSWTCTVTGLLEGDNVIRVCGTNLWDVQASDTITISRGYERDLPVLDPIVPGTVREHQVLLHQVTGRTNVVAVSCNAADVIGTSCFDTDTWRFSCVPDFNTASQVWNVVFVGTNQYGAETQTLVVTVAPHAKKLTPKKPLLFEDEDGDLLDIKYSGIKKGTSALVFDGQNIVVSNAYAEGKLSFGIKQNKKTGGDGLFILRDVTMDGDGKSASLAGHVDNVTAPQQSLGSLKFTSKTGVASNIWLGWAKTISAGKGTIVGTVAVSNGFETLSAGTISGARILAGVAATADATNTAATAGFKTVKATTMNNSIVTGRDTLKGDKVATPEIKVKSAAHSVFFHTGTNNAVTPEPILP